MAENTLEGSMSYRDELFARFYEVQKAIDRAVENNEPTEHLIEQKKELIRKIESQ